MALGPKAPVYYVPTADASQGWRLMAAVFNWFNHPSLLTAVPTGQVWDCQQSTEVNPDLGISITHETQTILATDPTYSDIFQKSGLDRVPNLHHITFSIGTRITDRTAQLRTEEERSKKCQSYEILVVAKTYDSANKVLPVTDNVTYFPGCYGGTDLCCYADWGWSNAPIAMLPILKDIFREWQCVVEYLKHMATLFPDGDVAEHPLLHMDVLGEGMTFRRAILREASTTIFALGGISTHSQLLELRNGRWEVLFEHGHSLGDSCV